MTITEDSLVERNPDIIFSEIDNETVMMDKEFENYFGLAEIGTQIWSKIEAKQTVKSLCEALMEEYAIDYHTCLDDVISLLNALSKNDMIIVN